MSTQARRRAGTQSSGRRPSGLVVIAAFAVAVVVAVALIAVALIAGRGGGTEVSDAPAVDLTGIPQTGMSLGDPDANVVLIEYSDIQCPYCAQYAVDVLPTIVDEYVRPGKVRAELRPIAILGGDSEKALRFVFAAGLQNRAWELQDALFRNQGREHSGWLTDELVRNVASEIQGLDVDRMFEDSNSFEVGTKIAAAQQEAESAGVASTPTFFVGIGDADLYFISVPLDPEAFGAALDDALQG